MKTSLKKYCRRTRESYIEQGKRQKNRFRNDKDYKKKILDNVKKAQQARKGKSAWNSGKIMPKGWWEKSGLVNPETGKPWNYKNGKQKRDGYVYIYDRETRKFIAEHRLVIEKVLGRKLRDNEIVHHRNQIRDDNREENLEIVIRKTHFGRVICPFCNKDLK
jgi:hypothetical protein